MCHVRFFIFEIPNPICISMLKLCTAQKKACGFGSWVCSDSLLLFFWLELWLLSSVSRKLLAGWSCNMATLACSKVLRHPWDLLELWISFAVFSLDRWLKLASHSEGEESWAVLSWATCIIVILGCIILSILKQFTQISLFQWSTVTKPLVFSITKRILEAEMSSFWPQNGSRTRCLYS